MLMLTRAQAGAGMRALRRRCHPPLLPAARYIGPQLLLPLALLLHRLAEALGRAVALGLALQQGQGQAQEAAAAG